MYHHSSRTAQPKYVRMLLKIPFLVCQTLGFYITVTPPNSTPSQNERTRVVTGRQFWLEPYMNLILAAGVLDIAGTIIYTAGLAEIVVLLAHEWPSHPLSSLILNNLLFPPSSHVPSAMRLTLPALIGSTLITAGGTLRYWCYRSLARLFTFHLSLRANHTLVTTGPYAYVRHPSYTGALLSTMGGFLVLFGRGGWVRESGVLGTLVGKAAVTVWVLVSSFIAMTFVFQRVWTEDKMLKDNFGKEWEDWAEKVPCKVIPGVF